MENDKGRSEFFEQGVVKGFYADTFGLVDVLYVPRRQAYLYSAIEGVPFLVNGDPSVYRLLTDEAYRPEGSLNVGQIIVTDIELYRERIEDKCQVIHQNNTLMSGAGKFMLCTDEQGNHFQVTEFENAEEMQRRYSE